MLPLSYFLLAWIILLAIFGLVALISIMQMLRYGVVGIGTYLSTILFLLVSMVVVLGTGIFLTRVDWTHSMNLYGTLESTQIF